MRDTDARLSGSRGRSVTGTAGELPPEHSSFVGRRAELAAARAALGSTRLLTVLGPGGVGKTRFAIRLARGARRLYADATWFIDLSSVSAKGSVAGDVERVLGLEAASTDRYAAVARFFSSRRGLLVLDSCEQVVDQCSLLARHILDSSPEMSIVATSREALRISPETTFVLEPLETFEPGRAGSSPAAMLFLERCAAFLPDPTQADLDAIAEICERLDGLPLAIELAATRVRALTPAQIRDRLAEPLTILTGGERDAPDRQQTMRATIAWSYSSCTDEDRALWRRMSVFRGGWDLESAEWMSLALSSDVPVLDVVQSLIEKSIVKRRLSAGRVTFAMLETVRMFGLEMTAAAELDEMRALHRDWYLRKLAELEADWYGPNQAAWLSFSLQELPNIRAALEFSLSVRDGHLAATLLVTAWRVVWLSHGLMDEMRRWCVGVVDLDVPATREICQLMTILGGIEVAEGSSEVGHRRLARAGELADELGDAFSRALVRTVRAKVGGDPEHALALYAEALELQCGANLITARANSEERLASAHDMMGNAEIAGRMREDLITRAIRVGDSFETAQLLQNAGRIASRRGELGTATELLRQALSHLQNLRVPAVVARVMKYLASVAADGHDYDRAARLLGISHAKTSATATASPLLETPFRSGIEEECLRMLGEHGFHSAFVEGNSLTTAEGIAYALGMKRPTRSGPETVRMKHQGLTRRESQVTSFVGQGLSNRAIAERLVISRRTAEGHVENSLIKLGLTSRTQLAAWAARNATDPEW